MNLNYYIKIAFRNLLRGKMYSFFLFFSMFTGLVTFILVSGYVFYEKGYDQNFPDHQNIFRVTTDIYNNGEISLSIPECERGISGALNGQFPEVEAAGFLVGANNPQYKIGEEVFSNKTVYHASPGFLDVFSISLVQGKNSEILTKPYTAIISENTARKYFGDEDPVGQILFKYPAYEYTIEGVYKDIPEQSHFQADFLLSFHDDMHLPPPVKAQWGETIFYTYLKVRDNADIANLQDGINRLAAANKSGYFEANNIRHVYHLQPLQKIHLHSGFKQELASNSNAAYINLVLLIGILILIASGFNYIQFSVSRLVNSARKTGIKKINGAGNSGIVLLSVSESLIIHFAASASAFFASQLLVPYLQNRFGISLEQVFANHLFLLFMVGIIFISILINGVLPALFVTRFNALQLLNLKYKPVTHGFSFRQGVVIMQFVIIIAIVAGITGIHKQVQFLMQKNTGFEAENTLVVKVPQNIRKTSERINNLEAFEHELLAHHAITGIASSNRVPGDLPAYNFNFSETESGGGGKAALIVADTNYIKNLKIELLAGRNFSGNNSAGENNGCIINRACLSEMDVQNPDDAIGRTLQMEDESGIQKFNVAVTGVAENVDFSDTKGNPEPIIFINWTGNMLWGNYSVKLAHSDFASVLPFIGQQFRKTFPNYPFEYVVLEDHYNRQFNAENQLIQIFQLFVFIAILISVINLFAISWLISSARIKEIGIRKVNGAKVSEILALLNKDFVKWVAIAFVVATPIAYYAMHKWLETFAYKTSLSWWIFALAGLLALGIALLTVSWQSWRAATRNPVEALRYE